MMNVRSSGGFPKTLRGLFAALTVALSAAPSSFGCGGDDSSNPATDGGADGGIVGAEGGEGGPSDGGSGDGAPGDGDAAVAPLAVLGQPNATVNQNLKFGVSSRFSSRPVAESWSPRTAATTAC
jgi:hypothetical protein